MRFSLPCLLTIIYIPFSSAEPLKVAGGYIDGLVEPFGQGSYSEVLKRLNQDHGIEIKLDSYPFKRVQKMFEEQKLDCVFPYDYNTYWGDKKVIESDPIDIVNAYIFTKPGTTAYTRIEELKGKLIGIREDTVLPSFVDLSGLNILQKGSEEANVKRLLKDKLDAIITYDKDLKAVLKRLNIASLTHSVEHPLWQHKDGLICYDTISNREKVDEFNRSLKKIRQDGTLAQILNQ